MNYDEHRSLATPGTARGSTPYMEDLIKIDDVITFRNQESSLSIELLLCRGSVKQVCYTSLHNMRGDDGRSTVIRYINPYGNTWYEYSYP